MWDFARMNAQANDPRTAIKMLLDKRNATQTICPSEVARSLAEAASSPDWQGHMPAVHDAIDDLLSDGVVQLSWKGKRLDKRAGPYRIKRSQT